MENSINSNDFQEKETIKRKDSDDKKKVETRKFPEIKTKLKRFDKLACCFFILTILFMIGTLIIFIINYKLLNNHHQVIYLYNY